MTLKTSLHYTRLQCLSTGTAPHLPPLMLNHQANQNQRQRQRQPRLIIGPTPTSPRRLHKLLQMDKKYGNGGGAAGSSALDMATNGIHHGDESLGSMRAADTLLRLVPMGLCVAALIVMLKNSQTNDYGSVAYSDLGAFKYLVHANGICAGYSFLSAVVVAMPRPSTMSKAWTVFCLDQLLTYIILAAGAVSTEVLYLAYSGDTEITWSAACDSYGKFCSKATTSVVITFVVAALYAFISIFSSYKLFSRYSAPPMADAASKEHELAPTFHG